MKFIFSLITFLSIEILHAQVLLVPPADRNFQIYRERCQKEGYLCTMNYLLGNLQKSATPQFDLLLEELDYSSKDFCNGLANRSLKILSTEMISTEQVEILIKLLNQAGNFVSPSALKPLQAIEKQLQEDLDFVQQKSLKELPADFIVVFKRPVSKFQSGFLKVKSEKIKFSQTLLTQENLVSGTCKDEAVHPSIQDINWQIDHEESCGLSNQIANLSRSSTTYVKENKNAFLIGSVIAVGAVLLLNKYEVEVSF